MIAFRTTAGKAIGFGHLRRCLTLAAELRRWFDASEVQFWIDGDQRATELSAADGFESQSVAGGDPSATASLIAATGADVLIVDSYDVLEQDLTSWRQLLRCLIVIDDLADRFVDAHAVLNGSPYAARLAYRTAPGCVMLLGPGYALLRPTFRGVPAREAPPSVSQILVTLGGADPHGSMGPVLEAIERALPDAALDVVVGPLFGPAPAIDAAQNRRPSHVQIHRGLEDLSPLMRRADLAVSGGGQTLYELAASGVPTVATCLAPNQEGNLTALNGETLLSAGRPPPPTDVGWPALEDACRRLADDRALRTSLSVRGRALFDGRGALRAADMMRALIAPPSPPPHE